VAQAPAPLAGPAEISRLIATAQAERSRSAELGRRVERTSAQRRAALAFALHVRDRIADANWRPSAAPANPALEESLQRSAGRLAMRLGRAPEIGAARAVVAERLQCSPGDAFEVLKRLSQHQNRRLADVAAAVVRQASQGGPPDRTGGA
jgi:hypothetical protein